MITRSTKTCSVCGDNGDGAHFGAEACRACAAFFRRSIAFDKTYICRSQGNCNINSRVRCMCRSCRFNKCLAVGMRKSAVQRYKDTKEKITNINLNGTDQYGSSILLPHLKTLANLQQNYSRLLEIRKIIHTSPGEAILTERQPKAIGYNEANMIHLKEIKLVLEWVSNSYADFKELPSHQKKLLYKNFFVPFMILECGYNCCHSDRTDILFLPSGDYIDSTRPDTFYKCNDGQHLMSSEDAMKIFIPSFEIYRKNILDPMRKEKVDDMEFFTLCSLVLWDHGLEGQTNECISIARRMRNEILTEILLYYRHVKNIDEPSIRLSNLLVLLPALQRSVRRFQEDIEINHVFNVYSVDDIFYELVNGRCVDNIFNWESHSIKLDNFDPY